MLKVCFISLVGLIVFQFYYCSGASTSKVVFCAGYCDVECTCTKNFTYQCANGQCIPIEKYHDTVIDCDDKTDETYECCPNEFKCDTRGGLGKCLHQKSLNDGVQDCEDGTDESINLKKTCDELDRQADRMGLTEDNLYKYQCFTAPGGLDTGKCIPFNLVLNGQADCPMEDDEDAALFDECVLGMHKCDRMAICQNDPTGSYTCACMVGYKGDGFECKKDDNVELVDESEINNVLGVEDKHKSASKTPDEQTAEKIIANLLNQHETSNKTKGKIGDTIDDDEINEIIDQTDEEENNKGNNNGLMNSNIDAYLGHKASNVNIFEVNGNANSKGNQAVNGQHSNNAESNKKNATAH